MIRAIALLLVILMAAAWLYRPELGPTDIRNLGPGKGAFIVTGKGISPDNDYYLTLKYISPNPPVEWGHVKVFDIRAWKGFRVGDGFMGDVFRTGQ